MDTNLIDQRLTQELTDWVLLVENEVGIYELSQSIYAMAETKNERGESLTPPDDIIFSYDHGDDEDFFINNTGIDTYQKYIRVDKTGRNVLEVIEDHRTAVWVKRNIERLIKPLKEIIRVHYANKNKIIEVLDFHMPSSSEKVIIKFEELLEKYSPIDEDLTWANESINTNDSFLDGSIKTWLIELYYDIGIVKLSSLISDMAQASINLNHNIYKAAMELTIFYDYGTDDDDEAPLYYNNTGINSAQQYIRLDESQEEIIEVIENLHVWFYDNSNKYIPVIKGILAHNADAPERILKYVRSPRVGNKLVEEFTQMFAIYMSPDLDLTWVNESINNDLFLDGFIRTWLIDMHYEIGVVRLSNLINAMARASYHLAHKTYVDAMELTIHYDYYGEDEDDEYPLYYNNTGIDSAQNFIRLNAGEDEIIEVIHNLHEWFNINRDKYIPIIKVILEHNVDKPDRIFELLKMHQINNKLTEDFTQMFASYMGSDNDLTWVNESRTPQTFTRTKIVDTILDWMDDQIVASNPALLFRTLTVLLETIHNYSVNYHFNGIDWWYIRTSDTTLEVSYEVADEKFRYLLPTNYESDDYASRKRYEMLVNLMYKDFINTAAPLIAHKMYILVLDLCKLGEPPTNEILEFFAKRFNRNIPLAFTKLEFDAIRYKEDVSWLNESATSQELITWMTGLNKRRIQK